MHVDYNEFWTVQTSRNKARRAGHLHTHLQCRRDVKTLCDAHYSKKLTCTGFGACCLPDKVCNVTPVHCPSRPCSIQSVSFAVVQSTKSFLLNRKQFCFLFTCAVRYRVLAVRSVILECLQQVCLVQAAACTSKALPSTSS